MLERTKVDRDFLDIFAKYGYGTTIWSPLASGSVHPPPFRLSFSSKSDLTWYLRSLLTGKYNDGIPAGSRFDTSKAFFNDTVEKLKTPEGQAKIAKVKAITKIAVRIGATPTTLALAWCAKNPNVTYVLHFHPFVSLFFPCARFLVGARNDELTRSLMTARSFSERPSPTRSSRTSKRSK